MAGQSRYKPDQRQTGELMRSRDMEQMLRSAARKGKAFAEGIAPHGTGEYAASFRVTSSRTGGVTRASAALYNESPHAIHVEVTDDYHVLARAADFIERTGP